MFRMLYIMRGVPGSGKSTVANSIVNRETHGRFSIEDGMRYAVGKSGFVLSTDFYFYKSEPGRRHCYMNRKNYNFNRHDIAINHSKNRNCCEQLMVGGDFDIVIDNTNSKIWEMEHYVSLAAKYGYKVAVVELPHPSVDVAVSRNTHGVPRAVIERMITRWEHKIPTSWSEHEAVKI